MNTLKHSLNEVSGEKKSYAKNIYKKKAASTKNYRAANSMHVLFRRRVLKWYFIQTVFLFSLCSGQARPKENAKQFRAKKKIFAIYILINSHVWQRIGLRLGGEKSFSPKRMFSERQTLFRLDVQYEKRVPGVSTFSCFSCWLAFFSMFL